MTPMNITMLQKTGTTTVLYLWTGFIIIRLETTLKKPKG